MQGLLSKICFLVKETDKIIYYWNLANIHLYSRYIYPILLIMNVDLNFDIK